VVSNPDQAGNVLGPRVSADIGDRDRKDRLQAQRLPLRPCARYAICLVP
jgi:hypothetical protein